MLAPVVASPHVVAGSVVVAGPAPLEQVAERHRGWPCSTPGHGRRSARRSGPRRTAVARGARRGRGSAPGRRRSGRTGSARARAALSRAPAPSPAGSLVRGLVPGRGRRAIQPERQHGWIALQVAQARRQDGARVWRQGRSTRRGAHTAAATPRRRRRARRSRTAKQRPRRGRRGHCRAAGRGYRQAPTASRRAAARTAALRGAPRARPRSAPWFRWRRHRRPGPPARGCPGTRRRRALPPSTSGPRRPGPRRRSGAFCRSVRRAPGSGCAGPVAALRRRLPPGFASAGRRVSPAMRSRAACSASRSGPVVAAASPSFRRRALSSALPAPCWSTSAAGARGRADAASLRSSG